MTWKQIKKAIDEAGLEDDEEISLIQCESRAGNRTFHKTRLGRAVKLTEDSRQDIEDSSGCAI